MVPFAFHQPVPEWQIVCALLTMVVVVTTWIFDGLGFGQLRSLLLSFGCAALVLAALFVRMWIAEALDNRRKRSPAPRDPPKDTNIE